ncbi:MAG: DUF11 domain-containing protein [Phycisphaerae bacterium]|nr:DUF11 domain-containing protein [Phycisphaerae bacterium]
MTRLNGLLAAFVAAGLALGGCAQQQAPKKARTASGDERAEAFWDSGRQPAAPAAAKPAEKPRDPAPPPAASGCNYRPTVGAGWNVSSLAFPTGEVNSSAIVAHYVTPVEVRAGAPYNYEIHITNRTGGTLQNVMVNQGATSNMTVVSAEPNSARDGAGNAVWNLGDLGPCVTKIIKVSAKADKVGNASSCVSVTYNNSLCAAVNVVQPALAITKTITPEALICDPITMTIEVKNTGSGAATNVKVKDTLPAGLTTVDGKTALELDAGNLATGQSKPFTVQLKASKTGKFDNSAQAMADGGLTAQSATVSTVVRQPALALSCKAPDRVYIGRDVNYEISVKNTGDAACANTTVTSPLPTGATFVKASDGGAAAGANVVWNLGNLAAGASKTVTLTVRPTAAAGTSIPLTATANCPCASPATTQCQTAVFGLPDIGTTVTDDDGVVVVGEPHTYIVEVKNQGNINLTNTKMVVTMPEGMTFVSSADGKLIAGNKVEFVFGTVAPGVVKRSSFVVKSSKSGELLVVGETTCSELKTPVRDDELTNFVDR